MADPATINNALETLQRVLGRYSESNSGSVHASLVDGQLPQGIYEDIAQFVLGLKGIENVSRTLFANEYRQTGAYDAEIGSALQTALGGETAQRYSQALEEEGTDFVSAVLRRADAPEIFVRNPALFVEFITSDLDATTQALDVLEGERLLNGPPVAPELRAAQPAAISALAENLRDNTAYYVEYFAREKTRVAQNLADLPEDATAEEKSAIETQLGFVNEAADRFDVIRSKLATADFTDFSNNADAQEALSLYVLYLQKNNFFSHYEQKDGQYSTGFAAHLQTKNEGYAGRITELQDMDERTAFQDTELEFLNRLNGFEDVMSEMVRTQVYIQPETPAAISPADQARPIIESAIGYMVRTGKVGFEPALGTRDNNAFDYDSRLSTQAFVMQLKSHLGISVEPDSGAYSYATRAALEESLADPENVASVANEFFKGDHTMVTGLIYALDVYSSPHIIPDIAGTPSNISAHNLLVRPIVAPAEVPVLVAAIERRSENELGAVNELLATMSGFGIKDILPLDALDDSTLAALDHIGQNRTDVMGDFFGEIYTESAEALAREGRPSTELESEITSRISMRLDSIFAGNNVFGRDAQSALKNEIAQAVTTGLQAHALIGTNDAERLEAASMAFAGALPSTGAFLQENGTNRRNFSIFNPDNIEGVTPLSIDGFAGAGLKAESTIAQAMGAPTIETLIADMRGDFEFIDTAPIAGRTMRGVEEGLAENRVKLEGLYAGAEKNADGAAILQDRNGETLLLNSGAEGLEIRYLGAAGISTLTDGDVPVTQIDESLGYDALMVRTALAGFQAQNNGVDTIKSFNPEFFEMAGTHYVVGLDKETSTLQIIPLDPDFINPDNTAMLNNANNAENLAAARDVLMQDPAYRFIRDNYSRQFGNAGTVDKVYETLAKELGAEVPAPITPEPEPVVVPEPLEGQAREEGLRSAFASAAGFEFEIPDIELGQPIENQEILYDILGYDPHAAFEAARYDDPASTYIVHGLEPDVWNGGEDHDEFTADHVLVTFQKDGALQTIAISKDDFAYNPLRVAAILDHEHEGENTPAILAADRNRSEYVEGRGTVIHAENIWTYAYHRENEYKAEAPEPGMLEDRFVLPRRWGIDGRKLQEELAETLEEDHGSLDQSAIPFREMLATTIAEITMPDYGAFVSDGGMSPQNNLRQDTLKV